MSDRPVDKIIIIILSFRDGKSKNKNIDHRVKETFSIISTQGTCETDHVFTHDSTMPSALNFCFLMYFIESKRIKIILEDT